MFPDLGDAGAEWRSGKRADVAGNRFYEIGDVVSHEDLHPLFERQARHFAPC